MSLFQTDYTGRDYSDIRDELITIVQSRIPQWTGYDTSDFGLAIIEAFAHVGDLMSYYLDRAANETSITTAAQRQTLLNFADIVGYKPSGPTPAQGSIQFTNNTGSTITLPVGTQVKLAVVLPTGSTSYCYFETLSAVTGLATATSSTVLVVEGNTANSIDSLTQTVVPTTIISSPTGAAYTEGVIPDTNVVDGSINVYTGTSLLKWTYVENIVEYGAYDYVFTTRLREDGYTVIVFGDNVNGIVPTEKVTAIYRTSQGLLGNFPAGTPGLSVSFIPGDTTSINKSAIAVSFATATTGGADGETLSTLRRNLKKAINTRNRAITLNDYEKLSVVLPGVGRAVASATNSASVTVYVQPYNDGTTTPGMSGAGSTAAPNAAWINIANTVSTFLNNRCPVDTTVTVLPPVYKTINLSVTVTISSAYKQRDVKLNVASALLDSNYGIFSYNGFDFGQTVSQSVIYSTIMSVSGVTSVAINVLSTTASGVSDITPATYEIPILPFDQLVVNVTGGIL